MKLPIKLAAVVFLSILAAVFLASYLIIPFVDSILNQSSDSKLILTLIKIFLLLILVILPISIVLWLILLRMVVKPIKSINEVAKTIALGDLGKRVEFYTNDEFAELGQNMNAMIHNLVRAFQNMANSLKGEKEKEKQLKYSYTQVEKERAKAEALLTSINEGVVAINKNGSIILFNEAASRLTGFSADEVVNQPYSWILKFVKEKDETPVPDFIKASLLGTAPNTKEHYLLIRKDGQKTPVLPSIGVIHSADNQSQGIVVALRDVSEMRKMEKTKDEFISIASHELRTPMTAIKGLISMIFEGDFGKFGEELKDPLQDIALSTDRLIQLVNDMLDVSRIEFGRYKFTLSDQPINKLTDEITVLIKPLVEQKGVKIEVENASDQVFTDPDKFKQILSNLLGNSVKFTDQGSISVSFKKNGDLLNIYVTDTGLGISKEDQPKLFSKFAQISSSQNGRPKGTGLGLYISRDFARKLGGDLWIEKSEAGKGTTFAFSVTLSGTKAAEVVRENLKKYLIQ